MRRLVLLSCLLLASAAAAASSPGTAMGDTPQLGNMSTSEFRQFHAQLARDLDGRKYQHVDEADRRDIATQQAIIEGRLAKGKELSELSEASRLAVFNAHQKVVAILDDAELDRVTCRKVHQIGSHRPRVECLSERDRMQMASDTRNKMRKRGQSLD